MKKTPRVPKGICYRLFQEAGISEPDEFFELIAHRNRLQFLSLIESLENLEGPMIHRLRTMACSQLQTLSHCYGAREI